MDGQLGLISQDVHSRLYTTTFQVQFIFLPSQTMFKLPTAKQCLSISSGIHHLTEVPPKFFFTIYKGAVTSMDCTNAEYPSSTPLPLPIPRGTTTFANCTNVTPLLSFDIRTSNPAFLSAQKKHSQTFSDHIFLPTMIP